MIEYLLAMTLTCADGKWILDGIAVAELTSSQRSELIIEVLQAMPDDCTEDQYQASGR